MHQNQLSRIQTFGSLILSHYDLESTCKSIHLHKIYIGKLNAHNFNTLNLFIAGKNWQCLKHSSLKNNMYIWAWKSRKTIRFYDFLLSNEHKEKIYLHFQCKTRAVKCSLVNPHSFLALLGVKIRSNAIRKHRRYANSINHVNAVHKNRSISASSRGVFSMKQKYSAQEFKLHDNR